MGPLYIFNNTHTFRCNFNKSILEYNYFYTMKTKTYKINKYDSLTTANYMLFEN